MEKKILLVTLRLSEDYGTNYPEGKLKIVEVSVRDKNDTEEIKDFIRAAYELNMCDMWEIISVKDYIEETKCLDFNGRELRVNDYINDTKGEYDGVIKHISGNKVLLFGMGEWLKAEELELILDEDYC